jgi:hypothetical protein
MMLWFLQFSNFSHEEVENITLQLQNANLIPLSLSLDREGIIYEVPNDKLELVKQAGLTRIVERTVYCEPSK